MEKWKNKTEEVRKGRRDKPVSRETNAGKRKATEAKLLNFTFSKGVSSISSSSEPHKTKQIRLHV